MVFLFLVAIAASACSGMSRSQAATALASRINGPAGSIRVFRARCVEKYFEKYPIRFIEDVQTARQYRLLEEAGLAMRFEASATSARCGTPYPESLRIIGITLTPKGVAERWPEHQAREGGWDIVPARRELVEVTAVVTESDLARAEFAWRLVPTAGGAALGTTPSSRRASATFQWRDDGWHLIRIDDRVPGLREPLRAETR
jgi:hypothetical protein